MKRVNRIAVRNSALDRRRFAGAPDTHRALAECSATIITTDATKRLRAQIVHCPQGSPEFGHFACLDQLRRITAVSYR